jgi:hypothetical protein
MFKRRILPVAGLILLAIATAWVTRSVLGADRRPRRAKAHAAAAAPRLRMTDVCSPTLAIDRAIGGEGELEVAATGTYRHTLWDRTLVWHFKVFEALPGGRWEIRWQQRYDHRPLPVPRGREVRPTFTERLTMPPGRYTLEIGLGELAGDRVDVVVSRVAWVTVR